MSAVEPVPLAWRQLTADKTRLTLSLAGIGFAGLLMFMQTGFQHGIVDSSTRMITLLNADLILVNRLRYTPDGMNTFERNRLSQARECPGVVNSFPLYLSNAGIWVIPGTGDRVSIRVYGIGATDAPLHLPGLKTEQNRLPLPGTAIFDVKSRPYFGERSVGTRTYVNHRPIEIIGEAELGPDFNTDGNLFVGLETYFSLFAENGVTPDAVDLGLLQLAPHADPGVVKSQLDHILPKEIAIYTKSDYIAEVSNYWSTNGATAVVFGMGVFIGFLIGGFICYQILYSDVTDHAMQFATLKAMGYSNLFLLKVVFQEALILSVLGFFVAVIPFCGLAWYLEEYSGLLMLLTPSRMMVVFVLTIVMNQVAAVLAMRKIIQADPADCF